MSDPLRTETSRTPEPTSRADRDAKIEQLLLAGLDHYFAGQYEQAINVWTRALFLDRSHARARAYIERARSAQAERQRESEALLHDGTAAVQRGDRSEARRLLDAAMSRGGATDDVLLLLDRVERLEHAAPVALSASEFDAPRLLLDEPVRPPRSRAAWIALGALVLVIIAAGVFALSATAWGPLVERSLSRRAERPATLTSARDIALLPVPRRSETALSRARALVSSGKLRDALPLLEAIRVTDPERAEADRLRADVQRQLLALGGPSSGAPAVPSATPTGSPR
ncbi:MAG TPA: tetratricopeptide repeat protein [Vicinamibacterales bacterium]|nr:tetratricopeptide repeat protein [Vicinamibacterales bacterium]